MTRTGASGTSSRFLDGGGICGWRVCAIAFASTFFFCSLFYSGFDAAMPAYKRATQGCYTKVYAIEGVRKLYIF
jgi:hypothetical protein